MPTIDIVSQICIFADYPFWRKNIQKYREKFNKVILYPSRHHGVVDLEDFWKREFKETWVTREPIDYGVEDWRQAETMPCLALSNADWIWFQEADFFVSNLDKFYEDIEKAMTYSDMIGWNNPTNFPYIHPSCLLIKRELLEKTQKDFKAHPEINGADHFAMITRDAVEKNAKITILQDLGYTEWTNAFHLGGLTYIYQDFKGPDTVFGTKRPEVFTSYNYWVQKAPIIQSPEFLQLCKKVEEEIVRRGIFPMYEAWRKFFI